jgi:hypothetical protein
VRRENGEADISDDTDDEIDYSIPPKKSDDDFKKEIDAKM